MSDPYIMVLVSLISFITLCLGLLIFKKIFPKKKIHPISLIILVALLPILSILRQGSYESGDLTVNAYKAMSFFASLAEGNIIPNWAGILNATYGYPEFLFMYPLPFYLISFFHFFGVPFLESVKLLIIVCYIFSGIFFYLWAKEELGKVPAVVAAIFYLYAPYHLVDMHFRVSLGEIVSFAIIPFALWSLKKFISGNQFRWYLLLILSLTSILLANQAIAMAISVFIILYILFSIKIKKENIIIFFKLCLAGFISLLLSTFFWLPVIAESQYTNQKYYIEQIGFVPFQELLYSPWKLGFLFQGPEGQLSFLLGYTQLFIILLTLYYLLSKKFASSEKRKAIFYIVLFFIFCFLMLPQSSFIWNNSELLRNFQFTFRLLLLEAIFISMLAGIVAKKLPRNIIILLCFLTIFQTILNWGNRKMLPEVNDAYLRQHITTTAHYEGFQPAMPKWVDPENIWKDFPPANHLEVVKGDAVIKEIKKTSTQHEYQVTVTSSHATMKENTLYFPEWTITANNKSLPIVKEDKQRSGVMYFSLNKGSYDVQVTFHATKLRLAARAISLITFISLLVYILIKWLRNNKLK